MNLISTLENVANQYPEKAAIVLGERRISYKELDEASNKIANTLLKMGVRKNDRVAMLLPNCPEFVTVYLGILKTGSIAVPLDTRYKIDELVTVIGNCQPKVLVTESPFLDPIVPVLSHFDSIEHVIDLSARYDGDKFLSYQEIMATSPSEKVAISIKPDDMATISYTSGPTTRPQGAIFSNYSLLVSATTSGNGFHQTEKDIVMLFALPLYHMFGLATVLLGSLVNGSTIIIVPGTGISIGSLMEAIENEKGTLLMCVPYIFSLAAKVAQREGVVNDLSSLRLCISGGAPLSVSTIRQFKKYYGFTIADIWGLTEAVSQVSGPPMNVTPKLGSAGKALPGWEIKVIDDSNTELPPDEPGEILVRGPIMKGYYNNPQATAKAINNGWLHTGDIGKLDKDGYLYITGRKKPVIILKGQNIYSHDVEEILCTHPKIAGARIIGVPDKLRGEIVRAVIQLKKGASATEQEIRHFCQEHMADYKSPKQIIFAETLPPPAGTKFW